MSKNVKNSKKRVTVTITNGKKDNFMTTTPLQERRISKALEGQMCPSEASIIKLIKEYNKETSRGFFPEMFP